MKNIFFTSIFLLFAFNLKAQENKISFNLQNVDVELLKVPSNPAFLMMGTNPTEIIDPCSYPEFYTSIQNASNNFSALPNNYGVSFTPYWWTKGSKDINFSDEYKCTNDFTFLKKTTFSFGIVQGISNNNDLWRYGVGFNSTLFSGNLDKDKMNKFWNQLAGTHHNYINFIQQICLSDPEILILENIYKKLHEEISLLKKKKDSGSISDEDYYNKVSTFRKKCDELREVIDSLCEIKTDSLINSVKDTSINIISTQKLDKAFNEMNVRYGFKWDIGGGMAINSPDNKIDSTKVYRSGFWTNMGYTIKSEKSVSLSGFLHGRYLYYDNINYLKDDMIWNINGLNTFDIGAKVLFEVKNKLSLSLETLYRIAISNDIYNNTYKINGLIQYNLNNNQIVYMSLGNDFNDESDLGPQELIVAIGFNIGFGNNFNISNINLSGNK